MDRERPHPILRVVFHASLAAIGTWLSLGLAYVALSQGGVPGTRLDYLEQIERLAVQGRLDEAATLCRRYLAVVPAEVPAYRLLARILAQGGDRAAATAVVESLIERRPPDIGGWHVTAAILYLEQARSTPDAALRGQAREHLARARAAGYPVPPALESALAHQGPTLGEVRP